MKNKKLNKKAQQEMVGFVLIVLIVIIGLLVFLIYSVKQHNIPENDIANNILSSIMKTTTSCAIVYEPDFDDIRDLFKSCYDSRRCSNTMEMACDTLEKSLTEMLDEVLVLEPTIQAYQLDFYESDSEGTLNRLHLVKGECNGTLYGSEPNSIRISGDEELIVTLRICVFSNFNY
ncbi:MAG: hypothetical protein KKF65_02845 [Nanoarchaeota archaeon]|nr:hypothetical protein [Nanoarchaeota archaeon]